MTVVDWLAIAQVAIAIVLAGTTWYYAWKTRAIVQEMRAAREAESAPYIVVYFDAPPGADFLDLVIKNFGRSAARDVRVNFDPALKPWLPGVSHPQLPAYLSEPIKFFPPHYELRTAVWRIAGMFDEPGRVESSYRTTVSYSNPLLKSSHSTITFAETLEVWVLRHRITAIPTTMRAIRDELVQLNRTLERAIDHQPTAGLRSWWWQQFWPR